MLVWDNPSSFWDTRTRPHSTPLKPPFFPTLMLGLNEFICLNDWYWVAALWLDDQIFVLIIVQQVYLMKWPVGVEITCYLCSSDCASLLYEQSWSHRGERCGWHVHGVLYLPGSVRQKAAMCSPEASLGRYFFFWASLPAIRIPWEPTNVLANPPDCPHCRHNSVLYFYLQSNGLMSSQCDGDGAV